MADTSVPRFISTIPVFAVASMAKAIPFYVEVLGFSVRHRDGGYAVVVRDEVVIHLTELNDESWRSRADFTTRPILSGAESFLPGTQMCRVAVDDVDSLYDVLQPRGCLHPNEPLQDQAWGQRDFSVLDPDGNLIVFFMNL